MHINSTHSLRPYERGIQRACDDDARQKRTLTAMEIHAHNSNITTVGGLEMSNACACGMCDAESNDCRTLGPSLQASRRVSLTQTLQTHGLHVQHTRKAKKVGSKG